MKFLKKVAAISTLFLAIFNCLPSVVVAGQVIEQKNSLVQNGFKVTGPMYVTSGGSIYVPQAPQINVYQENRSDGVYLRISANETGVSVYVNNSSIGVYQVDAYRYEYKVTQSGRYEVRVRNYAGESTSSSIYITAAEYNTDLSLRKEYRYNGEVYLIIKAYDNNGISSVKVNDNTISFNEKGGEESYRIYHSGTYTVKVTDKNGNTKKDDIYINVDKDTMSLSLSKEKRSGKTYLVIKANADAKINRVTVNGSYFSFPSSGGTEEYEITQSGTYKVVVYDKNGYSRSDSIYIDIQENTNVKPQLTVTQNYKVNNTPGWYLIIEAKDDGSITSITINGESIPFDASTGKAQYYVPVDATYTIVATDNDGNTTTKTTFAAGNKGIESNNVGGVSNTVSSSKVVFKLNSKVWTKDGIAQQPMNVTPKMVNSRVYLPIRYVAYALDVDPAQISWNSSNKTVTINSGYETIQVQVGSRNMYVNNNLVTVEAGPIQSGGRVMLPISQIKSAFSGGNVQLDWDNSNKQLTVSR